MFVSAVRKLHRRLNSEDGFTLIEMLGAIVIITIGLLGLIGGFNSARKLTLLSERRTELAHVAQLQLERLQTIPYEELLMISPPTHSASTGNPDYYVKESTKEYQFGTGETEAEALVISPKERECTTAITTECGTVASTPTGRECSAKVAACEWKDGSMSGTVYAFVTWHTDPSCSSQCTKSSHNYKRLTVVATASVPSSSKEVLPVRVSTLIAQT